MNALDRAVESDMDLRLVVTVIIAVAVIGLAWALWLIARERRRPAPARAALYQSKVTRDLAASAARAVAGGVELWRIRSTPQRQQSRVARHRRPPSRLAAFLGGVMLRMGGKPRRRPVRWVAPAGQSSPPPPVDLAPEATGAHAIDSPTQPLPVNNSYRGVTATGRAPMPPPPAWQPPTVSVLTDFEAAGVPADALTAALAMEPALREWAQSRNDDPDAELLHRIGPDDGRMVSESDRWPR